MVLVFWLLGWLLLLWSFYSKHLGAIMINGFVLKTDFFLLPFCVCFRKKLIMVTLYTIATFVLAALFCIIILLASNNIDGSDGIIKWLTRL